MTETRIKSAGVPVASLAAIGAKTGLKSVPILGNVISGGSALYNLIKGNWGAAALDAAGMIPVAGNILNLGRGVHAAGTALSAARGAAQAAPAIRKALSAGKSIAQAAPAMAKVAPKGYMARVGGKAMGAGASRSMAGPSISPPAVPKGFGSRVSELAGKYAPAGFGAMELLGGGSKMMGLAGLATALPGSTGAFANKWYMPAMLGHSALQMFGGGGGAEAPAGAPAGGGSATPDPHRRPAFKGYSPRNTAEMWNSYMTPYSSLDKERRLAFEVGVERFCKEANFDGEDTLLMLEMAKSGAWQGIGGLFSDIGSGLSYLGRNAWGSLWHGKRWGEGEEERDAAAKTQADRRRAYEAHELKPPEGDISTEQMRAMVGAKINPTGQATVDRATLAKGMKEELAHRMAAGTMSARKLQKHMRRTFSIDKDSPMAGELDSMLAAQGVTIQPGMKTRWTPSAASAAGTQPAAGTQSPAQTGWTPPPVAPIFGQSTKSYDAAVRKMSGGGLGSKPLAEPSTAMPSPGNPASDESPLPEPGTEGIPLGADVFRSGKGWGASW